MLPLPLPQAQSLTVVIGLPQKEPLLDVIAHLAGLGPVQVIVGSNQFNVHQLARMIRRRTVLLDQTLARIQQARPFTSYQMLTLLKETNVMAPLVVIDLLAAFYDENLTHAESIRLVSLTTAHLQRLSQTMPVLVTSGLPPPAASARSVLVKILQNGADRVLIYDPPTGPVQPALF